MSGRMIVLHFIAVATATLLAADLVAVAVHGGAARPPAPKAGTGPAMPAFAPATVPAPAPGVTAPPGDPDATGEVQAPAPGLYRYRETRSDAPLRPSEYADKVTAQPSPPGTQTVHIFSTTGVDETVAFTPTTEVELAFSQVGRTVAEEVSCSEDPPRVLLRLPLGAGASWNTSTRCTNFLQDIVREDRQIRVIGMSSQPVGTSAIPVWELVVDSTDTTIPADKTPATTRRTTSTVDVSARFGLVVRRVVQAGSETTAQVTDRLVSLQPA